MDRNGMPMAGSSGVGVAASVENASKKEGEGGGGGDIGSDEIWELSGVERMLIDGQNLEDSDEDEDNEGENELGQDNTSGNCSSRHSGSVPSEKELEQLLKSINELPIKYDWTTFAIRAGMTTVLYPGQMAQILMQLGYEPYFPKNSVTLLGRPCLLLPSTGSYLRYIYLVDGYRGIFHGLGPRITQQLLFTFVFDTTRCYLRKRHVRSVFAKAHAVDMANQAITERDGAQSRQNDDSEQSEFISGRFIDHCRDTAHELVSKLAAVVVSYPVHVVVVRTIAQFVGREHCIGRSILGEIKAIYQDFGIFGFYRGLVPKLIGEVCQSLAVGAITYFVSSQAPTIELRSLLNLSFSVLISAWTYQFSVVSTTMAVNGSCLKAGQPPIQPIYENWIQCWRELKDLNMLKRGSSLICRYYTGPTMLSSGMKVPTGMYFGPNHLTLEKAILSTRKGIENNINIQTIFHRFTLCMIKPKEYFQDVQLTTILDQDEVLMEIRAMNKKLLEFLTRPECMHEMLDLITTVPSSDIPIQFQYKFPNTACEVLTSDISFAEKIAAEPMMMDKLFHFFRDSESPLNPLLASFVCRVMGEMIARKLDQNWYSYQLNLIQVMGYLQSEPSLLQWLLKHVETSSVCDFFHKLVMNVEGQDMRSSLYEWLENKEHFFMALVNSMDRLHNKEAHMNVSRLVGDLLFALQDESTSSSQDRSMDSEPFLLALKSHATFERLLDVIFGEEAPSQSSIVYGLEMLLALLGIAKRPTKQNMKIDMTFGTNDDVILPNPIREMLINKMSTLEKYLRSPPNPREPMKLSNGVLNEPLGMERLAIVKFIAHIITLHDVELNEALIQSGVLRKALDLFWEHPWNNFLHHYVCQIVIQVTKIVRSSNCAKFLLLDYAFPEKIIKAFEMENHRAGYFGHLAKITDALMDGLEMNETMKSVIPEVDEGIPGLKEKFIEFYEGKWMTYQTNATQLLAGAALPTSGVSMTNNTHTEGVSWDDSLQGDFFEACSIDDEKSKSIFEMSCYTGDGEGREEDGGADEDGDSMSYPSDCDWNDPRIFCKFGQMALNGGDGSAETLSNSAASFIENPWAGQESVQVDNTDPWAAFEFSNLNNTSTDANFSEDWANFEQSFTSSNVDFNSATDIFATANQQTTSAPEEPPAATLEQGGNGQSAI